MAAAVHRVLVTGGVGSVGQVVVDHLLGAGFEVCVLDQRVPDERKCEFVFGNAGDPSTIFKALDGCDAVVHLGEIPNVVYGMPVREVFASNTRTGSTVFQFAAEMKLKRVVYASSCQVYGLWGAYDPATVAAVVPTRLPFDEEEPVKPLNAYAASKVANEHYLRMVTRQNQGFRASIFRLPATIPNDRIQKHSAKWWAKHTIEHFGEGYYTYLVTEDAARAFELALRSDQPGCETYHLVAKHVYGTVPLRDRIARHYAAGPKLPDDWPDLLAPVDCSKAKQHLGWEAREEAQ
jgi:nucleoside-diphosphate-sugar epimerase